MPRHQVLLERERGFLTIATGSGVSNPIMFRSRPGWASAVYHISVSINLLANNMVWGLTGNLSLTNPISIVDVLGDPLLIYGTYLSPPPIGINFPFEAPLLLPGRVLFRVRNESGGNRNFHIGLYYTQIEIGIVEWTDMMRTRSIEVST